MPEQEFNSVINQVSAGLTAKPEVGMGATELSWSDRRAYTIVKVISEREVICQADNAERKFTSAPDSKERDMEVFSDSQDYEYTPNPEGYKVRVKIARNGTWRTEGRNKGRAWRIGVRDQYHDFSF